MFGFVSRKSTFRTLAYSVSLVALLITSFFVGIDGSLGARPAPADSELDGARLAAPKAGTVFAELQVNATTGGAQRQPGIATNGSDYLVVWQSSAVDGDSLAIQGRRFSLHGTPIGTETVQINTVTTDSQNNPSVAATPTGWLVVWTSGATGMGGSDSDASSIQLGLLDATGAVVGSDRQINTTTTLIQRAPEIATSSSGSGVVVWQSETSAGSDADNWSIQAQRVDSVGNLVGGEIQVNTDTTGAQTWPAVAMTSTGEFVVVWRDRAEISAQIFAADGTKVGPEIEINEITAGVQQRPSVAMLETGDFLVAWQSEGVDGSGEGVRVRLFDGTGMPLGSEFDAPSTVSGDQIVPTVRADEDGNFTVIWNDTARDPDLGPGIFARRFASDSTPLDVDFAVHSFTTGIQQAAALASTADGDWMAVWESDASALTDTTSWGILGRNFRKSRTDLGVSVTSDLMVITPGDTVTLTISATNSGSEDEPEAEVVNIFPPELVLPQWTCTPMGSADCPPMGSGNVEATVDLPAGDSVEISAETVVVGATDPGPIENSVAIGAEDLVDADPVNDTDEITLNVAAVDFGDAPSPYPTTAQDDGARHIFDPTLGLGSIPDTETDGQPEIMAQGDDPGGTGDDGDGVSILSGDLVLCETATAQVFIVVPVGETAYLDGWVDFDGDGLWEDGEEKVFDGLGLDAGVHQPLVPVPCDATPADPGYARFRLSRAGSAYPTGRAEDGEVEDHAVRIVSISDVGIAQTLDTPPTPGTTLGFSITVTNGGPSPASASVTAPFSSLSGVEWTCSSPGGGVCSAMGTGGLSSEPVSLDPGASVVFDVDGFLASSVSSTFTSNAMVTLTSGTDPDPGNDSDDLDVVPVPLANLAVIKTDDRDQTVVDDSSVYTITVSNPGPSDAIGVRVEDDFLELTSESWTCMADPPASCLTGQPAGTDDSGAGAIDSLVDLPLGASVTFEASGTVVDLAPFDVVSNTVRVTSAADPASPRMVTDDSAVADVDYGDAPDCQPQPGCGPPAFPTLLANDGARHIIADGIYLGAQPDAEPDGQPTAGAIGDNNNGEDDEEGFNKVLYELTACETVEIDIVAVVDNELLGPGAIGYLNAWLDFDGDGTWLGVDEQIFTALPLVDGLNEDLIVDVPCEAQAGDTHLRLRLSTEPNLQTTGLAPDGEVEDYLVEILGLDYGDAMDCTPQPACGAGFPTLFENDGARHVVDGAIFLGSRIDGEPIAFVSPDGSGDDVGCAPGVDPCLDDEDGVVFLDPALEPESTGRVRVTSSFICATNQCSLQAWIDFDGNGTWTADEKIFNNEKLNSGPEDLEFTVPAIAQPGAVRMSRFRLSSEGIPDPTGRARDGEVEDHPVTIAPVANVGITKMLVGEAVPGEVVTYTVSISNPGPNDVAGVAVTDTPPAILANPSWSCDSDPSVCAVDPPVGGELRATVDLDVGTTVTLTLTGDLPMDAATTLEGDDLVNRATATVPDGTFNLAANDPDDPDGRKTAVIEIESMLSPMADLSVLVDDELVSAVAGMAIGWEIEAANGGNSDAPASQLTHSFDQIDPATVSWTCTAVGTTCPAPSGTGLLNLQVDLPAGSSLTFDLGGVLLSSALGFTDNRVMISPAAGIEDPNPANDEAVDDDTLITSQSALRIEKVDLADPLKDGVGIDYVITVTNEGPSDALGVVVSEDLLPAEVTMASTRGCVEDPAGSSSCTLGTIEAVSSKSFDLSGVVSTATSQQILNSVSVASTTTLLPVIGSDLDETTCLYLDGDEFPLDVELGDFSDVSVSAGSNTFLAAWVSRNGSGPDLQGSSIRAQRFDGGGAFAGSSFQVNGLTSGDQLEPAAAIGADGTAIVVWASQQSDASHVLGEDVEDTEGFSIHAQRYDAAGAPLGAPFQVNNITSGDQRNPAVAIARDGSFFIVWDSLGSSGSDPFTLSIQGRAFGSDGTALADQDQINTFVAGPQTLPDVALVSGDTDEELDVDRFAVVWQSLGSSGSDQEGTSIQGRLYTANGFAASGEKQLGLTTGGDQTSPSVSGNGDGGLAVVWQSASGPDDGDGTGILARRFDMNFDPLITDPELPDEFQVNASHTGAQSRPDLSLGADHNLIMTWESADGNGTGIYQRMFSPRNTAFGIETLVNTHLIGDQTHSSVAVGASGDFLIAWQGANSACRVSSSSVLGLFEVVDKTDLELVASAPQPLFVPGDATTPAVLAFTVENRGPSTVMDALMNTALPAEVLAASWSCTPSPGSICPAGPFDFASRPLQDESVSLPVGGIVTFEVTVTDVDATAQGTLGIASTIVVGLGVSDPNTANNSDSATVTLDPQASLSITKDDRETEAVPGGPCGVEPDGCLTYTIVARNEGPSSALGATVSDDLPAGLDCTLACAANAGSSPIAPSCVADAAPGTELLPQVVIGGRVDLNVDLPPETEVELTLDCTVMPDAQGTGGVLSNTATVTPPGGVTDPDEEDDNTATDGDTRILTSADLRIEVLDPEDREVQIGEDFEYQIVVTNDGPSTARSVQVRNLLPSGITYRGSTVYSCTDEGTTEENRVEILCDLRDIPTDDPETAENENIAIFELEVTANLTIVDLDRDPVIITNFAEVFSPTTDENNANNQLTTDTILRGDFLIGSTGEEWRNEFPSVGMASAGGFSIVWEGEDTENGFERDIYLRRFDSVGSPLGVNDEIVNTDLQLGNQSRPVIAVAPNGESIVLWESEGSVGTDVSKRSIQGQVYASDGSKIGRQFQVNSEEFEEQSAPDVAALAVESPPGTWSLQGWIAVWQGRGPDEDIEGGIRGQLLDSSGTFVGTEFAVNTHTTDRQSLPAVSSDAEGGFIVTWESLSSGIEGSEEQPRDTSGASIQARRFRVDGTAIDAADFQFNNLPEDDQTRPAIASMPRGEAYALWESGQGGLLTNIKGRFLCRDGRFAGGEVQLNGESAGDQLRPALSFLGNEDFMLVWDSTEDLNEQIVLPWDPLGADAWRAGNLEEKAGLQLSKITKRCRLNPESEEPVDVGEDIDIETPDVAFGNGKSIIVWEHDKQIFGRFATLTTPIPELEDVDSDGVTDACDRCGSVPLGFPPSGSDDSIDLDDNRIPDCAEPDLQVTKTDGVETATPGGAVEYTIEIFNHGTGPALGARIEDFLPEGIEPGASWDCIAIGVSSCQSGEAIGTTREGSGDLDFTFDIGTGPTSRLEIEIRGTIATSARGVLENTVTVYVPELAVDPNEADNTATDQTQLAFESDLEVEVDNGVDELVPGDLTTYTVTLTNNGPSDLVGAMLTDGDLPADLEIVSWQCQQAGRCTPESADNSAGPIHLDLTFDVPASGDARTTVTVVGKVADSARGTLTYEVTATLPEDTVDPDAVGGVETADDTDDLTPKVDLAISSFTATRDPAVPGKVDDLQYELVVTNRGPVGAMAADVESMLPAEATNRSWECVVPAGSETASCTSGGSPGTTASGTGDVDQSVDLPDGTSLKFILTGTLAPDAHRDGQTQVTAMASVTAPETFEEKEPSDNAGEASTTLSPVVDLAVSKDDGQSSVNAGEQVSYTITVSNTGPSTALAATVSDMAPATLVPGSVSWTCDAPAGASCNPASGLGDLLSTIELAPGGDPLTFEFEGTVSASATGTLINTANVTAVSETDTDSGNDSDSDQNLIVQSADVAIGKTNNVDSIVPGTFTTYELTITNAGPSDASGIQVIDLFPAVLTCPQWECSGTGAAVCPGGSAMGPITANNLDERVDVPMGASITLSVECAVAPSATGSVTNVASVLGVADPNPSNNSAIDTDTLEPSADLGIEMEDVDAVGAGGPVDYTVTVTNYGPSDAPSTRAVSEFMPALEGPSWDCDADAGTGASCVAGGAPGSDVVGAEGVLDTTVDLPVGASVVFTVKGTVPATATGTLQHSATVSNSVDDPGPMPDTAMDTATIEQRADLSITKTSGLAEIVAGESVTYTVIVSNAGPADALGARVIDTLAADLGSATWECEPTAGASCTHQEPPGTLANGSGGLNRLVDLPAGESMTFELTATLDSSAMGELSNTASVAMPDGGIDSNPDDNVATDGPIPIRKQADLSIAKTNGVDEITPGGSTTYTVTVSNLAGPSDALGVGVEDILPTGLVLTGCACVSSGTASCIAGQTAGTDQASCLSDPTQLAATVDLPVGTDVTFTLAASVDPDVTGMVTNEARIVLPADLSDPTAPDSASDTDTVVPRADLRIEKTNASDSVIPGQTDGVSYTITVHNDGPSDVSSAQVVDMFPDSLGDSPLWDCAPDPGAPEVRSSCEVGSVGTALTGISGDIDQTVVLPAGSNVRFTVTATLASDATGAPDGQLSNTASVSSGVNEINETNNMSTHSDDVTPQADLSISKTHLETGPFVPGAGTLTYRIVVTNNGPSDVPMAAVTDTFPAGYVVSHWLCTPNSVGASCDLSGEDGAGFVGTGHIDHVVGLEAGTSVTIDVMGSISPAATGMLSNSASVASNITEAVPGDEQSTDTIILEPQADLKITKTTPFAELPVGAEVEYTIEVENLGPSSVVGATVTDMFDMASLSAVTWGCTPGPMELASCDSGMPADTPLLDQMGDISQGIDLPVGTKVTFMATATITASVGTMIENTASVAPPAGVTDPDSDNDSSSAGVLVASSDYNVWVTKTDSVDQSVAWGQSITYTIVIGNEGPSDALAITITDDLPDLLIGASWTCDPTAGASCIAGQPAGTDSSETEDFDVLSESVDLPVGEQVTYTISVSTPSTIGPETGFVNTATVSDLTGDTNPDDNSSTVVTNLDSLEEVAFVFADDFESGDTTTWSSSAPSAVEPEDEEDPAPGLREVSSNSSNNTESDGPG